MGKNSEIQLSIGQADREALNGHSGCVIWFTGLSGAGKSTLANALEVELHRRGIHTYLLDGDRLRTGLNSDLNFTDESRAENIRRVAEVARLMMDAGLVVISALISPFKRERQFARQLVGDKSFMEVYVSTPLNVCEQRDVKGLYQLARAGKVTNMTGIDSPYEAPDRADCTIDTSNCDLNDAVAMLCNLVLPRLARPDPTTRWPLPPTCHIRVVEANGRGQ